MQYKLNGFLWLGLGLVIQAMAGVFISFGLGAGYYYVFTGVAAAALIVEIIGVSIVRGSGREFIWGRGLVIISAILEAVCGSAQRQRLCSGECGFVLCRLGSGRGFSDISAAGDTSVHMRKPDHCGE